MAPMTTPIVEQRSTSPQCRKVSFTPSSQPWPRLVPVFEMLVCRRTRSTISGMAKIASATIGSGGPSSR